MKRQLFTLMACAAGSALLLGGCSTPSTRISQHPEIFQNLSQSDQALVSQGRIRVGMSENSVWLAWGSPEQKSVGNMRGHPTETWIYLNYSRAYGYPYPYGYGYGYGFSSGAVFRSHHGRRFVVFGDPFYDPFFYSAIPPTISYPEKTVTFVNRRVVSYQHLVGPYRY